MSARGHLRRFRGSRNMSALWVLSEIAASVLTWPVLSVWRWAAVWAPSINRFAQLLYGQQFATQRALAASSFIRHCRSQRHNIGELKL
jgi:hypothetical protein